MFHVGPLHAVLTHATMLCLPSQAQVISSRERGRLSRSGLRPQVEGATHESLSELLLGLETAGELLSLSARRAHGPAVCILHRYVQVERERCYFTLLYVGVLQNGRS